MSDPPTLHYYPGNASLAPHLVLRELGAPFELALVDRDRNAQRGDAYLRLNPNGRIPTLVDGDLVLWESAAILLHLADTRACPDGSRLAPPVGTAARAHYYKWLVHLTNTIGPEFRAFYYPEERVLDPAHIDEARSVSERMLEPLFVRIDAHLATARYLVGDALTTADFYLLMLVRWGRNLERPPRDLPHVRRHADELLARPAVRETFATEGLTAPLI